MNTHDIRRLREVATAPRAEDAEPAGMGEARRRKARADAERAELDVARRREELVDRRKAVAHTFALARQYRDALQAWPARVAALMAAELGAPPAQMQALLERHVREFLAGLRPPPAAKD